MAQNGKGCRGSGSGKSKSGGGSIKIVTKKDRETKAINENILALRAALFRTDGKDKNVLEGIAPVFCAYCKNGINSTIEFKHKLSREEQDFAFKLTKSQMEDVYEESGYGWDDVDKKRELSENGARFLFVREVAEIPPVAVAADASAASGGAVAPAKTFIPAGKLIGFIHFRFTVQGEVMDQMAGNTTLYVMDVQVAPEYQRKGLGKHLITLMELIARRENMASVSIPIQNAEHPATSWVSKSLKGYASDVSLTLYGFDGDEEGFEVFAKTFPPATPKPAANATITTAVAAAATITSATATNAMKAISASSVPESVFTSLKAEIERESQQSEEIKLSDSFQKEEEEEDDDDEEEEVEDSDEEEEEDGAVDLAGVNVDQVVEQLSALYLKEKGTAPTPLHIEQWRAAVLEGANKDSSSGVGSI